jgi:hypothetical protein
MFAEKSGYSTAGIVTKVRQKKPPWETHGGLPIQAMKRVAT